MSKDMTKLKDELWIMQKDQKVIPRKPTVMELLAGFVITKIMPVKEKSR
jgi:hypothetical protein